jgi:hypothetical protein
MTAKLIAELNAARAEVRRHKFGSAEFDAAFAKAKAISDRIIDAAPREEFCSIDSGHHRTRLLDGRII